VAFAVGGKERVLHADEEPPLARPHITDCWIRLYMSFRQAETPSVAAVKAGFRTVTAYRVEQDPRRQEVYTAVRAAAARCLTRFSRPEIRDLASTCAAVPILSSPLTSLHCDAHPAAFCLPFTDRRGPHASGAESVAVSSRGLSVFSTARSIRRSVHLSEPGP
jgi:hypothetical protein